MADLSYLEFLGTLAVVNGAPLLVIFYMLQSAKGDLRADFKVLKDDVQRRIEAGTKEHEVFRQTLLKHEERFLGMKPQLYT